MNWIRLSGDDERVGVEISFSMSEARKHRILVQIDSDPQPSVFDAVVAVDAGADHLLSYGGITLEQVPSLVHGAIFTRGPKSLRHTAIFIGGSDVAVGEALLEAVTATFIGPMRVSVMLDANGANTTAAAAVLAARRHLDLSRTRAVVLAGTGPVGQRAVRLLARAGATVALASRSRNRAEAAVSAIDCARGSGTVTPCPTVDDEAMRACLDGAELVIAAGAAGVQLLSRPLLAAATSLKVAIDLNAVPPLGIEGLEAFDHAQRREGLVCYGAIGVGETKMQIHRAAVASLFERNELVLDADEIYELGKQSEGSAVADPA